MALPTSTNDVTARKLGSVINSLWTKIKSTFVKKSGDTMTGRLTLEQPMNQVLIGTGTAGSSSGSTYYPAKWNFDLGIATPNAGDMITIKMPTAGHDYGVYVSTDNGTTYFPVARNINRARLTTHYPLGAYITLRFETYVSNQNGSGTVESIFPVTGGSSRVTTTNGCWRIMNDYDSGNDYGCLRTENGRFRTGSTGCNPYTLVCLDSAGAYSMLISSGSGTGTSKTINTSGKFKLDAIILYHAANRTVAANTLISDTYNTYFAHPNLDTRYSHNHSTTFTTHAPVYIECTIDDDGYWSPTTKCITQVLETGKYYIYLGQTYSTEYQVSLSPSHPLYYYDGTNLTERPRLNNDDRTKLDGISAGANKVEASSTNGKIKIDGTDTTVYTHPTQTAYSAKGSATKVPKITTDSTGHVTSIEEVTITGVTPASHSHGNIANGGTLTDTAAAAAGNDYVVIRDADNAKIQTSTIKGTDVADAVSKKHSHSTLTLSTTAQAYDGSHTLALPSTDPYTSARTPTSHTHGNITNGGALQTNDITIASGDKLVVTDSSDSNKVARASISFDGSTTTQALTKAGTWATFNNYSHPAGSAASKTGVPTADATPGFGGTFKVNQITTDSTSHVSAVTERTITIPGTTATTSAKGLMSAADKTKLDREPITKNTSDVKVFCITKPITTNWYDNQTVHLYTGYVNGTGFELIIGVRQYSATASAPLTNLSVTLYRETPYAITITPYYKVDGSNIVLGFVFANKTTFRVTSPVTDMTSNISTLDTWDETGWTALPAANLVHRYNAWKDTTSAIGSDAIPTYVAAGGQIKVCTDDFLHDADITASSTNGKISVNGTDITVYTHPTTSGNKHIPSGGSSGQFLGWDSDGTAKWVNSPDTDTKVTQTVDTTNDAAYPLLAKNTTATSTITDTSRFTSGVTLNPKNKSITATSFIGNASTATKPKSTLLNNTNDLDTIKGSSQGDFLTYHWTTDSVPANAPVSTATSMMQVYRVHSGNYLRQVVYVAGGEVYSRTQYNGTWDPWTIVCKRNGIPYLYYTMACLKGTTSTNKYKLLGTITSYKNTQDHIIAAFRVDFVKNNGKQDYADLIVTSVCSNVDTPTYTYNAEMLRYGNEVDHLELKLYANAAGNIELYAYAPDATSNDWGHLGIECLYLTRLYSLETIDNYLKLETAGSTISNSAPSGTEITITTAYNIDSSDVTSTYSSTGTAPVNGTAVASAISGKAPTNHASTATTYGVGTASNYGHVKLDNSTPLTVGTTSSDGVATGKAHVHNALESVARASVTTADLAHINTNTRAHMILSQITSQTSTTHDPGDGYMLSFMWDNTGSYDAQLFIPDAGTSSNNFGRLKIRYANNSAWGDWEYLPAAHTATLLTSSDNLNNLKGDGFGNILGYKWESTSTPTNTAFSDNHGAELLVFGTSGTDYCTQVEIRSGRGIYQRRLVGGTWGNWEKMLVSSDIAIGSANGTISVAGTDVAVKGLGGAAYLNTGTASGTVATGNHTHTTSIASDSSSGTVVTLAHDTQYKLTAGGTSVLFKTPADSNTDTKVTQTVDTSNNAFPLLAKNTTATATITDTARFASTVTVNPSIGGITANRFTGALYNSKAYMQESSQTKSGIYLIIGSYTYTASKITPTSGDPFPRAYDNKDITFTMNSRHSGSGICVVSTQINGDNPTETSMTGVVRMYANAGAASRTSSPIYLYRSYTPNASTYTPSWTLTLVVSISDYNIFTINNVLERNGWTIKSGTIATYDSDPSNYVTEANLGTLGTRIATATFVADTDTKVTQTADNSSTGTGFEVLFSATGDNTTRTEASRKSNKLTFQPSTGTLTATKFSGPLTGDVTGNATSATKATQDSDGNAINATYFKSSGNVTLVSGTATKIGTQNGTDVKLTLPTIPAAANNGALKIGLNGGTATSKFTANQSGDSTLTFATGSAAGKISVDGTDVAVNGWSDKADKSSTVSTVAWDSTNKKITKTINGSTTDVVTAATLKTAMSLDNVNNTSDADKPVSTAQQTALDGKVNIANTSLESQTTTILAQVQSMASSQIHYKRFYTKSDGGSANISDKPTGTTNGGFMLEAYCNRYVSSSDWRYVVLCYVQAAKPKIAWIKNGDTSISWQDLNTDTHYTTHLYAGDGTAANVATTNGNTKLTAVDNSTVRNTVTLQGSNNVSVSSNANGVITIDGTHTHTTSLAQDSGTATVTLAHNQTYKLTAGGTSVIFKTPTDSNTDTLVKANKVTDTTAYKILASKTTDPQGAATEANYAASCTINGAGTMGAVAYSVNSKCTLQFNTTTNALDFVFN